MKIGVISDTHDNLDTAKAAVKFFKKQEVDRVIHCGDIVAPFTAELFNIPDFEFSAVRGNNDGEWNLKTLVDEFGKFYNNIAEMKIQQNKIAVYHGTEEEIVEALVQSGKYDYVLRGHTHEKKIREKDGTIEINPGGIPIPGAEEKFHVAILNLDQEDIEFHKV